MPTIVITREMIPVYKCTINICFSFTLKSKYKYLYKYQSNKATVFTHKNDLTIDFSHSDTHTKQ